MIFYIYLFFACKKNCYNLKHFELLHIILVFTFDVMLCAINFFKISKIFGILDFHDNQQNSDNYDNDDDDTNLSYFHLIMFNVTKAL